MTAHFRRAPGPPQKPPRPFSEVSAATPEDCPDLVYFLRSVREEIGDGEVEDSLVVALAEALTHRQGGIAFVVKGQRGIEASLGIRFDRPWYTQQFRLFGVWNVVDPMLRATTGHAKSLLVEAQRFADKIGRPLRLEELTLRPFETKSINDPKLRLCGRNLKPAGMIFSHFPAADAVA
jgi:hypothetical protein